MILRFASMNEVEFPSVAICNTNPFSSNASVRFFLEFIENNTNYSYSDKKNLSEIDFINYHLVNIPSLENKILYRISNLNREEKIRLNQPFQEMILDCYYKHVECDLSKDFEILETWYFGLCYVFNLNNGYKTNYIGIDGGLSLDLYSGNEKEKPKVNFFQLYNS